MQENNHSKQSDTLPKYDYIFSGTGASASLLLLELFRNNLLHDAKVLLVDQEKKDKRDKTFCFWSHTEEPICDALKRLISHSWDTIELPNSEVINLSPLRYNHISSIDLYREVQQLVETCNWQKLIAPVEKVSRDEEGPYIIANGTRIRGAKIFDSRTPVHQPVQNTETHIYQSFVGWMIETQEEIKQSDAFRFMDFNIEQQGFTQFVYVLPFSSSKALVEVTRFGAEIIQVNEAEILLEKYIEKNFGKFIKLDVEQGCIPMSNSKIENDIVPGITTLGARNYKIKPSTGYAFKNMYYHARALAEAIKKEENTEVFNKLHTDTFKGRFAFYDALLLDILKNRPREGKRIFVELFEKVETQKVLKFLDEKTSIKEDISIFAQLPWGPFLAALFRRITKQSLFRPLALMILSLLLMFLGNETTLQSNVAYGLFLIGLILVGIPHGAVDHLLETGAWDFKKAPNFIFKYLFLSALLGLTWYFIPSVALIIFLAYSSWHFGQADGKQWRLPPILSISWGASVLFYILGTHIDETNAILASMGNLSFPISCPVWAMLPWLLWALYRKQASFVITILWLTISSEIPLLLAFGLYFIGQHSLTSWQHLQRHLKMSHKSIWLHSLPFHAGAWIFLALFYFLWPSQQAGHDMNRWGVFFIFIACISLPHAIAMHAVYSQKVEKS